MECQRIAPLRGPNVYAKVPVLEVDLNLRRLRAAVCGEIAGVAGRVHDLWAVAEEHAAVPEPRPEWFDGLHGDLHVADVLRHLVLRLQRLCGSDVHFGHVEPLAPGLHRLVVEYEEEEVARACLEAGRRLCRAAVHGEPCDAAAEIEGVRDLAHEVRLGPSTGAIVRAALRRGIPVRRLNRDSLVQLGHGATQRRICAAETDATGQVAEHIAKDKELTRAVLKTAGVPVPDGRPVRDADDAWEAARALGLPVVVKPRDGNHGRGVAVNLTTREQVLQAYAAAREEGTDVVVEKFIPGDDYRVLVIGDRMVAAAHREPAQVRGDGQSTIEELIAEVNRDPRRSEGHATVLSRIKLDAVSLAVLANQGYTPQSVPPAGARVLIRRNANLSTGGTATDVTDRVHPEVARRVVEAARVVGLDIAGIDLVVTDISRPLEEQSGAVVEVNAGPGLRMHLEPSAGRPRPVGEAVVDLLFPAGGTGRIPVVAVTGAEDRTVTTRLVAHLLRGAGRSVGMGGADGVYVNERCIDLGEDRDGRAVESLLFNPRVETAVLEASAAGVLEHGLGFDRCAVAVVVDRDPTVPSVRPCTAGQDEPVCAERVLVEAVAPSGTAVLNAEDAGVLALACRCPGEVIYFAADRVHPVLETHRRAGGRTVFVEDGAIRFTHGEREAGRVSLSRLSLTYDGHVALPLDHVLAAAAGVWVLSGGVDGLRAGLESFFGAARPRWARTARTAPPVLVK
jgi:cyanophycin synthetase